MITRMCNGLVFASLALAVGLPLTGSAVSAQERVPEGGAPAAPAPAPAVEAGPIVGCPVAGCLSCAPAFVPQCFPVRNMQLMEHQQLITVPKLALRAVETRVPVMDVRIEYKDEKRTTVVTVMKPREETVMVNSVTTIPEMTTDPCTGCSVLCYKQIPICKAVKRTVYDCVPETQTYTIQVPVVKPYEREYIVRKYVVDATTAAAVCKTYELVDTKSSLHTEVPACPLPAIPPTGCRRPGCACGH